MAAITTAIVKLVPFFLFLSQGYACPARQSRSNAYVCLSVPRASLCASPDSMRYWLKTLTWMPTQATQAASLSDPTGQTKSNPTHGISRLPSSIGAKVSVVTSW